MSTHIQKGARSSDTSSLAVGFNVLAPLAVVLVNFFDFQGGDCDAISHKLGMVCFGQGLRTLFLAKDSTARNRLSVLGDESVELNTFERRANNIVGEFTGGNKGENQSTNRSRHKKSSTVACTKIAHPAILVAAV